MVRVSSLLVALLALVLSSPVRAQQNGFDLAGPDLSIAVTRGGVELPITAVPSLRQGDRLTARAAFSGEQSARYLLVVAFLRGATNPPPKNWFFSVETWRTKKNMLDVVVPDGAEQAILFLAPQAGGGFDAVRGAVRGRPGIFVRAAQDLHQASLDRARLDAFVSAIGRIGDTAPERLVTAAPVLANALRIKLNAECLSRQRALQAACLTQSREALVLQAQRGATLAETLTGTPVDLAYRVAATREGGAGYYSPYIGLARDLARLFGAFRSAQYQYLPALALGQGDRIHLQLNAAPSFQNPRSVLVAPLPPIGAAPPPLWRSAAGGPLCLAQPGMVVPLEEASLLFATGYARDLTLAITAPDGTVAALPVVADAERGGLRLADSAASATPGPVASAIVQGRWGFDRFSGPRVPVQQDAAGGWTPHPDAFVVVGRDHPLMLRGGAAACVAQLALQGPGGNQSLTWKATGADTLETILPLGRTRPGPLTLTIARHGATTLDSITLTGRAEPSRLDRFVVHAGDRTGILDGARLDQVRHLELGGRRFVAGTLTRGAEGDRLEMTTDQPVAANADATSGTVLLRDGRNTRVGARIAAPRPVATLLSRASTVPPVADALPLMLPDGVVASSGTLTFSFRVGGGLLSDRDTIDVVAGNHGTPARLTFASGALQRAGGDVVVASIAPQAAFGAAVAGPVRFRVSRGDATGDWQPLADIVRLPSLTALDCPAGSDRCRLSGRNLFVIAAISDAADMRQAVAVPAGFVAPSITLPRPAGDTLYLRLHDVPDAVVRVQVPTDG